MSNYRKPRIRVGADPGPNDAIAKGDDASSVAAANATSASLLPPLPSPTGAAPAATTPPNGMDIPYPVAPTEYAAGNPDLTNVSYEGDTVSQVGSSFQTFITGLALGVAATFIYTSYHASKVARAYAPSRD